MPGRCVNTIACSSGSGWILPFLLGTEPQIQVQGVQAWHRTGPREAGELRVTAAWGRKLTHPFSGAAACSSKAGGCSPSLGWFRKMVSMDT